MSDRHHVLLIGFGDPVACRAAYEEAKQLPGLRQVAVLERSAEGIIDVPESHVRGAGVTTVGSGMVGGLVGLLGGPIGVLLGFAAGAAIGNAAEQNWERDGGAGLILLSAQVQDGTAMLVVDLTEADPEPADRLAAEHGGHLERRPADRFADEVRKAREAAEQAPPEDEES